MGILIAAAIWLVPCSAVAGPQDARVRIRYATTEGSISDPVRVVVSGLGSADHVTITVTMTVAGTWSSSANYTPNARGEVRLDPVRVFGAMSQVPGPGDSLKGASPPNVTAHVPTTIRVERDGVALAESSYRQWFATPGVRVRDVREKGLVGQLFTPASAGRHPAILVLGGSEGGIDAYVAAAFASHGYVALALAYFREESLPRELLNIPMEYFLTATQWLQQQPSVDGRRLAVYGKSRGSEAALLLATLAQQYRVVIASAPSSVVGAGVGPQHAREPAWTYEGQPIPFAPNDLTLDALQRGVDVADGAIPIERSRAAVVLLSGGADRISRPGASTLMGDQLIARLRAARHPFPYLHLSYPNAGHTFGILMLPGPILASGGGTPEGNARATADATPRLFAFLKRSL